MLDTQTHRVQVAEKPPVMRREIESFIKTSTQQVSGGVEYTLGFFDLTPEFADLGLRSNFAHNRKVDTNLVQRLVTAVKNGTFVPCNVIFFVESPDGEMTMLNGQHSCRLASDGNVTLENMMIAIWRVTADQSDEDLKNMMSGIYASFDAGNAKSMIDRLMSLRAEESLGINKSLVSSLNQTVTLWVTGGNTSSPNSKDADQRKAAMEKFKGAFMDYRALIDAYLVDGHGTEAIRSFLNRAGVSQVFTYALHGTQKNDPETHQKIKDFIIGIAEGKAERGNLCYDVIAVVERVQPSHNGSAQIRMAVMVAMALNAYIDGKKLPQKAMAAIIDNSTKRKPKSELETVSVTIPGTDFTIKTTRVPK